MGLDKLLFTIGDSVLICSGYLFRIYADPVPERGVPKELEEAAKIDGCNAIKTLWYVIVPMLKAIPGVLCTVPVHVDLQ